MNHSYQLSRGDLYMATQWKYKHGDEELGPFTSGQLKQLAAEEKLTPEDLVWKEGLPDWVPAKRVKGLFETDTKNAAAALSGINLGTQIESPNPRVPTGNSTPDSKELPRDQPSQTLHSGTKPEDTDGALSSRKLPKAQPLDPNRTHPIKIDTPPRRQQAGSTSDTSSTEDRARAPRRKVVPIVIASLVLGTLLVAAAVLLGPKLFHSEPPLQVNSPNWSLNWRKLIAYRQSTRMTISLPRISSASVGPTRPSRVS